MAQHVSKASHILDRDALDRVIAVINGKGGVLKTTLVANIGGILAKSGYKVLLVDLDPQGNLAEDLGYTGDERDDEGQSLAKALIFGGGAEPIRNVRDNLDVFAGGLALDKATAALAADKNQDNSKLSVARLLEPIAKDYDMVILDCPPGDETLQTSALAAARWALVPVKSDKSSRKGLSAVAARLDAVLSLNPSLDLLGVVLVDTGSTSHAVQREAREQIAALFNSDHDVTFGPTIRHAEATAQATRERGLLVHELDEKNKKLPKWYEVKRGLAKAQQLSPRSAGSVADDLFGITQEVVARITAAEPAEVLQ